MIYLSEQEVSNTKNMVNTPDIMPWFNEFLQFESIKRAVNIKSGQESTDEQIRQIKSSLFEVRFAHAINKLGFEAEYEFKTGVGGTSVDFKINIEGCAKDWLVELTSLTSAIGDWSNDGYFGYSSISNSDQNCNEVLDLVKAQNALFHKVCKSNKRGEVEPIKFPENSPYHHAVILDTRASVGGMIDSYDFCNICFGSAGLPDMYKRFFRYRDEWELFKGIFDINNANEKSRYIRERIDVIGFINEKDYLRNEIVSSINLFANPSRIYTKKLFPLAQT
jgi:hypothetical protein